MNISLQKAILAIAVFAIATGGCAPAPAPTASKNLPRDPTIDAYVGAMRADLSDGKVRLINDVMRLTPQEAAVFWPIYQDYESELFELGDQRVALIRRFSEVQKADVVTPSSAKELADQFFKFKQGEIDVQRKYCDIISTEISPVRAAQFTQIEHRVGTVVDLTIASELPLLEVVPVRTAK